MTAPLHLALGDSAAGCLREACRAHGLPGAVVGIPDDYSHGPLDDGQARIAYMRSCYQGYDDWPFEVTDAFDPWRAWLDRLGAEPSAPVVIWSGPNASEAVFLAMACWWLRGRDRQELLSISLPGSEGRCHVAAHAPEELTALYETRQALTVAERARLAADFERIRDAPEICRRWEEGHVVAAPADSFDHVLLDACTGTWQRAIRVVGTAMARSPSCHSVNDLFLCSRLQVLILAGRLEADAPRHRFQEYAVRLPGRQP